LAQGCEHYHTGIVHSHGCFTSDD